jgi:hypothetical protein
MKLKEFAKIMEGDIPEGMPSLPSIKIKEFRDQILQCEEFSETKDLIIMDMPNQEVFGKVIESKTMKMPDENFKFIGPVALYTFFLTPPIYKLEKFISEENNNIGLITPLFYSPDFEPIRKIILNFSPDNKHFLNENELRAQLHQNLDILLNDPKSFTPEGERSLLVRGSFKIK